MRRPRRPIVAATVASSSGVDEHLALADRATSRRRGRRRSPRPPGSSSGAAPRGPRVLVEAEALGGLDEPLGAELGAQRGEDGVAGVREGLPQRAAAGLAVGVLELHALDRGRGLDRELGARLDDALLERARQRDDLERRAGRLGRGEGDAREPQDLAGGGLQHGDAAEAAGQRLDRGALDVGVDRGAHVRAGLRLGAGDDPRAGAQDAAGRARQPLVELALEPVEPDRRALGTPRRAQLRRRAPAARGRRGRRPRPPAARGPRAGPGPCASGVPSRARIAPRAPSVVRALQPLALAQAGEDERRAPVDGRAVLVLGHRQDHVAGQPPEDLRLHPHRQVVVVVVAAARLGGTHLRQRHRLGGLAVGAHEALEAGALLCLLGQQRVHRRVVPALPRVAPTGAPRRPRPARGDAPMNVPAANASDGDGHERREPRGARAALGGRPAAAGARAGAVEREVLVTTRVCPSNGAGTRRDRPEGAPPVASHGMTGVDWIIVGLLLLLALFGWAQGFVTGALAAHRLRARGLARHAPGRAGADRRRRARPMRRRSASSGRSASARRSRRASRASASACARS